MFNFVKKIILLIISRPSAFGYCLLLKMGVDRCIGSCNDKDNPFLKFCLPDSIKNISVKYFDLISKQNFLKNISFHQSCKCGCLLDEKVCNNLQKWNKDKCRCKSLKIKDCDISYSWNVNNCRCEIKKLAALTESERSLESERFLETEECDVETDKINNVSECKAFPENKTITLIKKVKDWKPFISVSVLFLCVSITLTGIMIYFYLKSKNNDNNNNDNNVLPY